MITEGFGPLAGSDVAVRRGLLEAGTARRVALLARLAGADRSSAGGAVSGEAFARTLGISRSAVHKHVEHLRTSGVAVVSTPGLGYRLEGSFADLVVPETVLSFFDPRVWASLESRSWAAGLPFEYVPACDSTNRLLKEAAGSGHRPGGSALASRSGGVAAGALLVTDAQTGGHGRLGRVWTSEPGKDLTFSVLLRPDMAPGRAHLLSLAAAVAVAEVVEALSAQHGRVTIKWPNDVLVDGEKICGILLEGSMDMDRLQWAVAGIGLNVNSDPKITMAEALGRAGDEPGGTGSPADGAEAGFPRPVSLREHLGREVFRAPLLAGLLERLTTRWSSLEAGADIVAEVRERDGLAGRRVVVRGVGSRTGMVVGEAMGIGADGELLVRDESGATTGVLAGDVTLRPIGPRSSGGPGGRS